jgi:predicted glycoside hydrolase/deacetylase ChbG (UPF0249 family)
MNRKAERPQAVLDESSVPRATSVSVDSSLAYDSIRPGSETSPAGLLVVNADDWGRNYETTARTLECARHGTISSVSAMVFMQGSERAAGIARARGIDAGLHLNFTTPFSASCAPTRLSEHQHRLSNYLSWQRLSQCVFHPGLAASFEYVVKAQLEEFSRLYGRKADRIDGHHHMHLCANVLFGGLLPAGTIVRRNFSFAPGEKSWGNRFYREIVDRVLARKHPLVDYFFSLLPLDPSSRLDRMFSLARRSVVELETHPINSEEYRFLTGREFRRLVEDLQVAPRYPALRVARHETLRHLPETQ